MLFIFISWCAGAQSKTTHQVAKGETLYSISKKYHVTVAAIEKANKAIGQDLKLRIGQKIIIPGAAAQVQSKPVKAGSKTTAKSTKAATTAASKPAVASASAHIVAKGETLYGIARANGLKANQLMEANGLTADMKLKPGQKLIIPTRNDDAIYQPAPAAAKPAVQPEPVKQYPSSPPPVARQNMPRQETIEPAKPAVQEAPARQEVIEPKPAVPPAPAPAAKTAPPAGTNEKATEDENPFVVPAKTAPGESIANRNLSPDDYAAAFSKYPDSGKKKMVYRGICTFMLNDNPGNQYLALYNYGEMGSILKVTNMMSKESIYVKVIGKVPASDGQNDVILKVSSDAANKLKVSEDKFLVEVTGYNAQ
jgi:LysM repeat protein